MQVDDKTLTIGRDVWLQHGGVEVAEQGDRIAYTARDDESYVKVLNHFGRVLKLYTFENGRWVDADTGVTAQPFDESQAGRLPAGTTVEKPRATPAAKARGKAGTKATAKSGGKSAPKAGGKAGTKATGGAAARRTTSRKPTKRRAG